MVNKIKQLCCILTVIFVLFIVIPSCFALNETQTLTDNIDVNDEVVSLSDMDKLSEDYYFNSSNDESGDGSIDNPYQELNIRKIKDDSTLYLANGEYSLNKGKTISGVTFIGEDPEKTVIYYSGSNNCGEFEIGPDTYVSLKNITFIGFNFYIEGGTFYAENCIFKDTIAPFTVSGATDLVNSAVNSFGGVIAATYSEGYRTDYGPAVYVDNCTFINNTAEYGGAIFVNYGELHVSNSQFDDNYAYNYGGAINTAYDVAVTIENTTFNNDKSLNDAGGAIYLLDSSLLAYNISIINCSSFFGGALTSLNSTLNITYLNAADNIAKYDGGAIYQMYNDISVRYSNFTNNYASKGGAIFVDAVDRFELAFNNFEENTANLIGGAVYSVLTLESNLYNNSFKRNKANFTDDVYETDEISIKIGSNNYTLIYSNYTYDGELPSKYNLLTDNYVTPVKDQQSGGNCWAFTSIGALESAILKATGQSIILSEENMKNIMELYSDYGWYAETNDGGFDEMAIAYLVSWLGPVLQSSDEYDDFSMLSPVLDSFTHVQNIVYLGREDYDDNDDIKRAILNYGAVATEIYMDDDSYMSKRTNAYYCPSADYANHAIVIVGWDDSYSRNNFKKSPPGNGAWICKNSWNTDWGDDGYFYVSYYDAYVGQVGNPEASYAFVFNDSERYDKNYQYDIIGKTDYFVTKNENIWVKNIFEADGDELLAAVSTYFRKTTDYELSIYVNDGLVFTKNGTCIPGYTTINLGKYIPIHSGDKFVVQFKLTGEEVEFAISEKSRSNNVFYAPGVSYFSNDGTHWTDLYDYTYSNWEHSYYSQVACIKAFTIQDVAEPLIRFNISTEYNNATVNVEVGDVSGKVIFYGNVTISIDGVNYSLNLKNGEAKLDYTFEDVGQYQVAASFGNFNSSEKINIDKVFISFNHSVVVVGNNVSINMETLNTVNTNLTLIINNKTYIINIIDGKGNIALNDLDFGNYSVIADVNNTYRGSFNSSFEIIISKTLITASDLVTYYDFNRTYSVELMDIYGRPVVDRLVSFILENDVFYARTDEMGIASTFIAFKNNTSMNITFEGDEEYFPANASVNIEVNPSIIPFKSIYLVNSQYKVNLVDKNGNPLNKSQINLFIDGVEQWTILDNGWITVPFNLDAGNHTVIVVNPDTGEILYQTITCVPRITGNDNFDIYYLSKNTYKILVYDDDANPVGANESVQIVVNGISNNVLTTPEGYALYDITLNPGTYTIKATYKGYTVSNSIIVKPLLTAKNISKKKAKKIKFGAKLVDSAGKPVKGKTITFKIKGTKYKAKTNAKGIAKITLKNLKVGKYTIKTKYGQSTIKNTIKIKK